MHPWHGSSRTSRRPLTLRPPNVVLILADDLGWTDLGCYGADLHETPHIDRLAREGARFTSAYAASICSPTRAALMTGKHYARLHMTIWYEGSQEPDRRHKLLPPDSVGNLPLDEVTLAERLRAAGYLTALVGKWHLGDAGHYPETQGFDVNIGGTHWVRRKPSSIRTGAIATTAAKHATCPICHTASRANTSPTG